jgi:diguanylate cyclase (GGDEF)-like protein
MPRFSQWARSTRSGSVVPGVEVGLRPVVHANRGWLFFVGGETLLLVVAVGPFGAVGQAAVFLLAASALVAMVYSVRRYHPSVRWPWWALCAALLLFLVDNGARSSLHTVGNLTATRSLLPDFFALPGYALLALGLFGFSHARGRGRQRHHLGIILDGLIAALAVLAVAWVYVIGPELFHRQIPLTVRLVLTCYPAMSSFLVVVTLRILFSPDQARVPAYWLLMAAMSALLVGDVLYALADSDLAKIPVPLLTLPYGVAFLAAGAMATHASMRYLTEPTPLPRETALRWRLVLVAGALLIPAILALRPDESIRDRITLSAIVILLTLAATMRLAQAIRTAERSEARMTHQALHDSLTGLPNRRMMHEHLARTLQRSASGEGSVALLFLDLDRFKVVNDTLGHSHGDALLVHVAQRLQQHVRASDLVTRIGGDEFMIVLDNVVSVAQALDLAQRLRSCLRAPFEINGVEFDVTASAGLAFASGDDPTTSVEILVREADTAMHQAKEAGRDSVALFDESMRIRLSERLELERDLRHAIDRRQLHLVYQPILRVPHGPIEGVEALIRWDHPTLGIIPPVKFIPLAEESGLIVEIGDWVLDEALRQLTEWRRQGFGDGCHVAVNLSAAQLRDGEIAGRVQQALERYELDGDSLCLELTESVVMDDPSAAMSVLQDLRRLGIHLAIDDFGTEYSSLAYLKRFPVTALKIDRSFVSSLDEDDSSDATLIAAIVAMAQALGITTIAEGVETPAQADRLRELGCDSVQGYLYSRPVRADRLLEVADTIGTGRGALQVVSS